MNIIIDNKEAVLKKGSSFEFIAENRFFIGAVLSQSPIRFVIVLVTWTLMYMLENFADLVRWQLQKVDPHIGAVA